MPRRVSALLCTLMLVASALPAHAAPHPAIATARQLMERHQAAAAYNLLAPLAAEQAGDPAYDYLLGIAALDSGHATEAVFALERVVDSQPDNQPARLELARAYYLLGEKDSAKREFETVKASNPPKAALTTINRYLAQLTEPETTTVTGFVQAAVGHDSNVNNAPSPRDISINFAGLELTVPLPDGATAQRDDYDMLSGALTLRHALRPDLLLQAGLGGARRHNQSLHGFDTYNYDGQVGLAWLRERDAFQVTLFNQSLYQAHQRSRRANLLSGVWVHEVAPQTQTALYGQWVGLRYPGQSVRDANRIVLGAAYLQQFEDAYASELTTGFYGAREATRDGDASYLGHRAVGMRLGGRWSVTPKTKLFLSGSLEWRHYLGENPLFGLTRRDRQGDVRAGVEYALAKALSLTGSVGYTRNRSTLDLSDYRRWTAEAALRFELE